LTSAFTAHEPHYLDHLAPVWHELGGPFYVPPKLLEHAAKRGIEATPYEGDLPPLTGLTVVAAKQDVRRTRQAGQRAVMMHHGNGQSFGSEHPGYAGGPGFEGVVLFLCPNEVSAARWRARYDVPVEVVGCPRLDRLTESGDGAAGAITTSGERPVVISFHWDARARGNPVPETWTAWPHYCEVLPALAERFDLAGHAHPRIAHSLQREYDRFGIEYIADFEEVLDRAAVYVNDCSSTLYEAAAHRPVVVMNTPDYRRHVEHGLRFWQHADVGEQVETGSQLGDAIACALQESPAQRARRAEITGEVFAHLGDATRRAAALIGPASRALD
jgi:hypothetical protein